MPFEKILIVKLKINIIIFRKYFFKWNSFLFTLIFLFIKYSYKLGKRHKNPAYHSPISR